MIVCGFFIGYFLLPRLFRSSSDDDDDSAPQVLHRVRDNPAIEFSPSGDVFIVEGKMKQILSGAIHYFRVVPDYWEDRLLKLKAAGLNTVETYASLIVHVHVTRAQATQTFQPRFNINIIFCSHHMYMACTRPSCLVFCIPVPLFHYVQVHSMEPSRAHSRSI